MIPVLSKPADQVGAPDIKALVSSSVPEGQRIEFKKTLPAARGQKDPWISGKNKIGKEAKDKLLKEVVALANAYGGACVLGIEESSTNPRVAARICPVPRYADLAERLKLVFRDRVEPQLPHLEIFPVPTSATEGVVVLRVPRSLLAPHRIKGTWICPIRRSDRSEEMSMREIQDMTLNMSRGNARLDTQFQERASRFESEFGCLASPDNAYGLRITAVPVLNDIRLNSVFAGRFGLVEGLDKLTMVTVMRESDGAEPVKLVGLEGVGAHRLSQRGWRPLVRAARTRDDEGYDHLPMKVDDHAYREIHCDGTVEFGWMSRLGDEVGETERRPHCFYTDNAVVELANVICWADALRRCAQAVLAEYAVDVALHVRGERLSMQPGKEPTYYRPRAMQHFGGHLPHGVTQLPRYSFTNDPRDTCEVLCWFQRDLCHAAGIDPVAVGLDGPFVLQNP